MKRIGALVGAALILFALGFNLARDNSTADGKGAPTYSYSTTYMVTEWKVRPAGAPTLLDGSDLPVTRAPPKGN